MEIIFNIWKANFKSIILVKRIVAIERDSMAKFNINDLNLSIYHSSLYYNELGYLTV